jgi:hypothetical protein
VKSSMCSAIAALLCVTIFPGCATVGTMNSDTQESKVEEAVSEHKETAFGALILGGIGAGIGYALGGKDGAAIGAGAGAALGAGIGQILEHKDRKRTETVSEVGHRPEMDDPETLADTDSRPEGEMPVQVTPRAVVAVAQATELPSGMSIAPAQSYEGAAREVAYHIVRSGQVVGSLSLNENTSFVSSSSSHGGSVLLCPDTAPGSCAMLELRRQ